MSEGFSRPETGDFSELQGIVHGTLIAYINVNLLNIPHSGFKKSDENSAICINEDGNLDKYPILGIPSYTPRGYVDLTINSTRESPEGMRRVLIPKTNKVFFTSFDSDDIASQNYAFDNIHRLSNQASLMTNPLAQFFNTDRNPEPSYYAQRSECELRSTYNIFQEMLINIAIKMCVYNPKYPHLPFTLYLKKDSGGANRQSEYQKVYNILSTNGTMIDLEKTTYRTAL